MGHYPCCCNCDFCEECFPCDIAFRLDKTPGFLCNSSFLTDPVFNQLWVVASRVGDTCKFEYVTTVGSQPDITLPPSPTPQSPPFTCGPCVDLEDILTVRFEITVLPIANCNPGTCTTDDFGGYGICQYCGFQYDIRIFVEPVITGLSTQDNEEWVAFAYNEFPPDECQDYIDIAKSRGFAICPRYFAFSDRPNHINLDLCTSGPILDFSQTQFTVLPDKGDRRRSLTGVPCDDDTSLDCACWWQFNPTSPTTQPCTETTDATFVNCIDLTYGSSWENTDWDEDGTIPSTDGWWFTGLDCTDLDTKLMKATNDVSNGAPCYWTNNYLFDNGTDYLLVQSWLTVVQADEVLYGSSGVCWDSTPPQPARSCTAANSWLDPDISLLVYLNYKFRHEVFFRHQENYPAGGPFWTGKYTWLSQNDFTLGNIWASGVGPANPLKPFTASSAYSTEPVLALRTCANLVYTSNICTFVDPATITFPTTRTEEMHCKSNHTIPDVTLAIHVPSNC